MEKTLLFRIDAIFWTVKDNIIASHCSKNIISDEMHEYVDTKYKKC